MPLGIFNINLAIETDRQAFTAIRKHGARARGQQHDARQREESDEDDTASAGDLHGSILGRFCRSSIRYDIP